MESLTRLVNESLADHGYEPKLDHRRLQWSKWFRCESSFSVLLAPCQPGIFALGEEIVAGGAGRLHRSRPVRSAAPRPGPRRGGPSGP